MIKIFVFLIAIVGFDSPFCSAQKKDNQFIINGKVTGRDTGRIVLTYTSPIGKEINDTAILRNGYFTFTGIVNEPTRAYLQGHQLVPDPYFNIYDPNFLLFYLEPSKMTVALRENDYADAAITGSATERENEILQRQLAPALNKFVPLSNEYEVISVACTIKGSRTTAEASRLEVLSKRLAPLKQRIKKIRYAFLLAHPDSYVSSDILETWINPDNMDGDSATMYFKSTSKRIQNSYQGRIAYKKIEIKLLSEKGGAAAVGALAPDFSENDQYDNPVKLSSFKNKNYVLLDFWATWCGPCMETNPRIKEFYKQYHDKGLQVIGLSMDLTHDKWLTSLKKNDLELCPQIYLGNLNSPGNFAKEKYGVTYIPQFILIDKQGKIIGRFDDPEQASAGISLAEHLKIIFN